MFNKNEFNAQLARRGVKKIELAKVLGIEYTTLYRKIEDDGKFSREEIAKIIDYLKIDNPLVVQSIFFANDVTQQETEEA